MIIIFKYILQLISLACVSVIMCKAEILEDLKELILRIIFGDKETRKKELFGSFLYCPKCLGFWIGLIGSIFINHTYLTNNLVVTIILQGFLVSYISSVLGKIMEE